MELFVPSTPLRVGVGQRQQARPLVLHGADYRLEPIHNVLARPVPHGFHGRLHSLGPAQMNDQPLRTGSSPSTRLRASETEIDIFQTKDVSPTGKRSRRGTYL